MRFGCHGRGCRRTTYICFVNEAATLLSFRHLECILGAIQVLMTNNAG